MKIVGGGNPSWSDQPITDKAIAIEEVSGPIEVIREM
jgi:hypothetical protein